MTSFGPICGREIFNIAFRFRGSTTSNVGVGRMIGRRYFAAISLFVRLEDAPKAYVSSRPSSLMYGTYPVSFIDGNVGRSIGWVHVHTNPITASAWNKDMRERTTILAFWKDNHLALPKVVESWPGYFNWAQEPINISEYHPVQLTTVYPVRGMTESRAAKAAWALLLAGDRTHTEWYDASPDRRWSRLFRH